jgi:hypothetical protein
MKILIIALAIDLAITIILIFMSNIIITKKVLLSLLKNLPRFMIVVPLCIVLEIFELLENMFKIISEYLKILAGKIVERTELKKNNQRQQKIYQPTQRSNQNDIKRF